MSVDRYFQWTQQERLTVIQHTNWLELPDRRLAIVVTFTPPVSRNATMAALVRVTDPTLPILVETFKVPYGELYTSKDDGWQFVGVRTWCRTEHGLRLYEPVHPQ